MSHILVSVLVEVAANCYFSMHTQFSTSPDVEDVSCAQVQEKQFVANKIWLAYNQEIPMLPIRIC